MRGDHTPATVYAAVAANAVIAVAKFTAAAVTGSSAMLSEGIHSAIDTGNEVLMLVGVRRSRRGPDAEHPFGYGKELYFWSLIVAVMLFGVGGGMSVWEGAHKILRPEPIEQPVWNYVVLGVALLAEGTSWEVARRALRKKHRRGALWRAMRASKDPTTFVVLGEDSAALGGIVIAGLGVAAGQLFGFALADGIASVLIGVLLGATAFWLAVESKDLLLGESASEEVIGKVRTIAEDEPGVVRVGEPFTMHLGPENILLNLLLEFDPDLGAADVTATVERLEKRIRESVPEIRRIFIEASSLEGTRGA
ncbi:MAG: cation diffusion facilitator family transporter [Polyangiales bacterium]